VFLGETLEGRVGIDGDTRGLACPCCGFESVDDTETRCKIRDVVTFPVGKITEKAVCKSVFLTAWHCILSAELTKSHSFTLCVFGDFAHLV